MFPSSKLSLAAAMALFAAKAYAGTLSLTQYTEPGNSDNSYCAVNADDVLGCTGMSQSLATQCGDMDMSGNRTAEICGSAAIAIFLDPPHPDIGYPVQLSNDAGDLEACQLSSRDDGASCTT